MPERTCDIRRERIASRNGSAGQCTACTELSAFLAASVCASESLLPAPCSIEVASAPPQDSSDLNAAELRQGLWDEIIKFHPKPWQESAAPAEGEAAAAPDAAPAAAPTAAPPAVSAAAPSANA